MDSVSDGAFEEAVRISLLLLGLAEKGGLLVLGGDCIDC
jgi:hypothetical protein